MTLTTVTAIYVKAATRQLEVVEDMCSREQGRHATNVPDPPR